MNPLFKQYGQQNDIMKRFAEFQRTFKGDPQQMVQQLLNSGRVTQEQVNKAAEMANRLSRMMPK